MNAAPTSLAANQDRAARLAQRSRTRHVLAVVILVVALVASCAWTLAVGRLGTPSHVNRKLCSICSLDAGASL